MFLQFNLLIAPTCADSITVTTTTTTTPGGITGQVAVTKVGALIAGDALAILSGTEIKIESKSKSKSNNSTTTPQNPLLNGVLMQTKTINGAAQGYVVFNGGERFSRINSNNCPDKVTTTTGATYTGSITDATASALTISTSSGAQTVGASDISDIHSARAFKYNISDIANPNPTMQFTTTCIHSAKAATEGNTMKKVIIVGLALTIVAVAIAVPIAVSASHHHHNNNLNNIIAANYLRAQQSAPMPMMPAGMRMPTPQQLGASYIANLQRLQSSSSSSSSSVSSTVFSRGSIVSSSGSSTVSSGSTGPIIVIP